MVRQRPQLLLDQLERAPERRPARQRLVEIERPRIEPHREQAGEPAHRARQVHVREHLLAAVSLEIEQQRMARLAGAAATPPAPVRHRQHQAGQQHVVDAAMERRRHTRQQCPGDRGRQCEGELPGGTADVASAIERTLDQRKRRLTQHPGPERKLFHPRWLLCVRREPLRPAPERGAARRQRRLLPARNRRPGGRQVRHQDAPRHAVHRQMVDGQQQATGALPAGIEPAPPAPSYPRPAPAAARPPAPAR